MIDIRCFNIALLAPRFREAGLVERGGGFKIWRLEGLTKSKKELFGFSLVEGFEGCLGSRHLES